VIEFFGDLFSKKKDEANYSSFLVFFFMKALGLIVALFLFGCGPDERNMDSMEDTQQELATKYMPVTNNDPASEDEVRFVLFKEGKEVSEYVSEEETRQAALKLLKENPFIEVYFTNDIEFIRDDKSSKSVSELYNFTHPFLNNIEWTLKQPLDLEGFELYTKANSTADSIEITYECNNRKVKKTLKPIEGKIEDKFSGDCSEVVTRLYVNADKVVGGYYTVDIGFFNSVDF